MRLWKETQAYQVFKRWNKWQTCFYSLDPFLYMCVNAYISMYKFFFQKLALPVSQTSRRYFIVKTVRWLKEFRYLTLVWFQWIWIFDLFCALRFSRSVSWTLPHPDPLSTLFLSYEHALHPVLLFVPHQVCAIASIYTIFTWLFWTIPRAYLRPSEHFCPRACPVSPSSDFSHCIGMLVDTMHPFD